ncbi:MAG: response regulator transcription factor [Chloroflexi bacterium]|nr:response regulator transcription factor [Chloroflexota bacterium]
MDPNVSNIHGLHGNGTRKTSVMLVDDDPAFLQILAASLQANHQDQLDIVGIARSGEDLILKAQALTPKVVLLDLNMPGRGGLWAIPLLRILFPEMRVIALTFRDDENSRRAVLAAGGNDLVSKTAWKTDLIPAIQRVVEMDALEPLYL